MAGVSKAVLITGCSSGIGHATAGLLAERGWRVYATARRPQELTDLEARGCRTLALDVCDEDSMRAAVDAVVAAEGAVGVLVNNAGYGQFGAVESVPIAGVRRQFETNVVGALRLCQLVLPGMRDQEWGRIVTIGSMGGKVTFPGMGLYHATKYSLEALSDALRFEVRGFGVDVILLEPGLISTRFEQTGTAMAAAEGPYAAWNRAVADVAARSWSGPIGKLGGGPETVAAVVAKALDAPRPKARYKVTPSAALFIWARALAPDRVWDFAMRRNYPTP